MKVFDGAGGRLIVEYRIYDYTYLPIRSKTLSFDTNDGFLEYSTMYFEMIFLRKLISLASFRIVKTVLEIIVNSVHLEFI